VNKTKLLIYVVKASLAPVVVATALWAKGDAQPTTWALLALATEAIWQGVNAGGAFLSDPTAVPNPETPTEKTSP